MYRPITTVLLTGLLGSCALTEPLTEDFGDYHRPITTLSLIHI